MSEQKQRTTILGLTIFMAVLVTLMFLRSYLDAGNLNPPASPASTMHTLDEIYNSFPSRSLPQPEDVEIINKYHTVTAAGSYQTIHTVTTGKTFYLMGCSYHGSDEHIEISLNNGSSRHFVIGYALSNLVSSYPIAAVSAGTEIKIKCPIVGRGAAIWGYEETNS